MKKLFTIASLVALTMVSCATDEPRGEEKGEGRVTIACNVATDVTETRANVTCTTPAEEDFALVIEGVSLGYKQEYASLADYDEESYLYKGTYKATVTAGDIAVEGYDKATFVGSEEFVITPRQNTEVNITAKIANALVKVEVTDNFKLYFPGGYELKLTTAAGNEFDVTSQTEPLFIAPASFVIGGTGIKQANQSGAEATTVALPEYTNSNVEAQHYYTVKLDVSNVGQATLTVTLNDELVEELAFDNELNDDAE